MRIVRTDLFKKDFTQLPISVQKKFIQKIPLLISNPKHPSLWVKKMKGHRDIWEASINMFYRFTFEIHNDYYLLRRIGPHDNVLKKP